MGFRVLGRANIHCYWVNAVKFVTCCLIAVTSGHVSAAGFPDQYRSQAGDQLAQRLLSELGARPTRCPTRDTYSVLFVRTCGKASQLKTDPNDALFASVDDVILESATAKKMWVAVKKEHTREYRLDEMKLTVWVDTRKGIVEVRYPLQDYHCVDDNSVPRSAHPDLVDPVRQYYQRPQFPVEARTRREGGTVILEAVVRRDGTVTDACVLDASPQGLGFEEASIEALRQSTYTPGSLHGEPVDVRFKIVLSFTTRGVRPIRK